MKKYLAAMPLLLLLAGCWDERQLKDAHLAFGVGIDAPGQQKVKVSLSFPESGTETTSATTQQVLHGTGTTFGHATAVIDHEIGGRLDLSKLRVMLIGEETAHEDVYPLLDAMYRSPASPLNAKLAIVEGSAESFFKQEITGEELFSRYFRETIESGEDRTLIPKTNLQLFCSPLFDKASDPFLPLLSYVKQNKSIKISGSALFHGRKMTGKLTPEETTLLLVMRNETGRELHLTLPSGKGTDVTVAVKKATSDVQVTAKPKKPAEVKINMDWQVTILEYPPDQLDEVEEVKKIEKEVEQSLEKMARRTISKMQQANSDAIGIGRKIMTKNPADFDKRDWTSEYPTIPFEIGVKLQIQNSGVIL